MRNAASLSIYISISEEAVCEKYKGILEGFNPEI